MGDLFRRYLTYAGRSEIPDGYHRWVYLSIIASLLSRNAYFPFGHSNIYPNMYILLMGAPAARKSAAIGVGSNLLKKVGYKKIAPERMSREAFLDELKQVNQPDLLEAGSLDALLDAVDDECNEFTVHASEFIDFMGQGDKDYLMLLTTLYDNLDSYRNPKVVRKSIEIVKPTVNLLGAATQENLNMAFPANMMDTGTLSRFLFIHSDPTTEKILIPTGCQDPEVEASLVQHLKQVRELRGAMSLEEDAEVLLEGIYKMAEPLKDQRFSYYSGRRLNHLLKLSMIHAAARLSLTISAEDVLTANTVLCAAEARMPEALGNFGSGRNSQVIHGMLQYVLTRPRALTVPDLYRVFAAEFTKHNEFLQVIEDLVQSGRVRLIKSEGNKVVLEAVKATVPTWAHDLMLPDILTDAELAAIGVTR